MDEEKVSQGRFWEDYPWHYARGKAARPRVLGLGSVPVMRCHLVSLEGDRASLEKLEHWGNFLSCLCVCLSLSPLWHVDSSDGLTWTDL